MEQQVKPAPVWPDTLRLRDTCLNDDLGGLGQRIYTTAGAGYEKREYVRGDLFIAKDAEVARLREALDLTAHCLKWWHEFNEQRSKTDQNALDAARAALEPKP